MSEEKTCKQDSGNRSEGKASDAYTSDQVPHTEDQKQSQYRLRVKDF
jgi:hypothetical protein